MKIDDGSLCPAGRTGRGTALVIAVAAIDRLPADGGEWNFRSDTAAVTRHADHLTLTAAAISVAGHLPLVSAVLAALRFVRKATFGVESLFVLTEHELLATIGTIEIFI